MPQDEERFKDVLHCVLTRNTHVNCTIKQMQDETPAKNSSLGSSPPPNQLSMGYTVAYRSEQFYLIVTQRKTSYVLLPSFLPNHSSGRISSPIPPPPMFQNWKFISLQILQWLSHGHFSCSGASLSATSPTSFCFIFPHWNHAVI